MTNQSPRSARLEACAHASSGLSDSSRDSSSLATCRFLGYPGGFLVHESAQLDGTASQGRSNTSRPLTQSAYQLVGGHAPSGEFAFSYSYTESSETSCRGNPDAAADNSWAVKMVV